MVLEANCIDYVFSELGMRRKDAQSSLNYYHQLIKPHFEEVKDLESATALAIVRVAYPSLVVHLMLVVNPAREQVKYTNAGISWSVKESLHRALAPFAYGLSEGQSRIAYLALLENQTTS